MARLAASIRGCSCTRSEGMRKPRELRDGARYHVTARANRREMILDPDEMKELFLRVLKRARSKYDFRIENFCVMGNHFHLVIRPGRGQSLSSIMRWILSVFAMAYNRAKKVTGHVWGARFFSTIIANLRELTQTFEYIDDNPVKAGQVDDRRAWRHGGLWHHRSGRHDILGVVPSWMVSLFPEHSPQGPG